jgi:hypothetical protein
MPLDGPASRVPELLAHRALNPPASSSLADEKHVGSLLLRSAARDCRRSQLGDLLKAAGR